MDPTYTGVLPVARIDSFSDFCIPLNCIYVSCASEREREREREPALSPKQSKEREREIENPDPQQASKRY